MTLVARLPILLSTLLMIFLWTPVVYAQDVSQEFQLKLAFIINFGRFINWPEETFKDNQSELDLCVLGKNPFGNALSEVVGKKVGNRSLVVKKITSYSKEQRCHLLYVGASDLGQQTGLLPALKGEPIVTVSDGAGFVAAGGSIEFVIRDDKLSFIINNSALKESGIQASSSLLSLAASVH
jgi:hypothetical protein